MRLVLGGFRESPLERDPNGSGAYLFLHRAHAELGAPALGQQLFE